MTGDILQRAMEMAYVKALDSPDPSTQNGAVLVHLNGRIEPDTLVCNEFPCGVEYTPERWERPLKYSIIEHAERNSLYAAASWGIQTAGLVMVCPWAACTDRARAIIQCGITELVTLPRADAETNGNWNDSISIADQMLAEAEVYVNYFPASLGHLPPILRNGELVNL